MKAAGGARPGVDLSGLNLARLLVDGEQILVGVPAPAGLAARPSPPRARRAARWSTSTPPTESELEALPEVGPVTAQAILAWRDEHGGFTPVDELLEVDGIGDATLASSPPSSPSDVRPPEPEAKEPPDLPDAGARGGRLGRRAAARWRPGPGGGRGGAGLLVAAAGRPDAGSGRDAG